MAESERIENLEQLREIFGESDDDDSETREPDFSGFDSDLDFEGIPEPDSDESTEESDENSSNSSEDGEDETWSDQLTNITCSTFEGIPGIRVPIPQPVREVDFFNLMFGEEEFRILVEESNRFARQTLKDNPRRLTKWKDTTVEEMKAFIGIWILMGLNSLPSIANYWSKDPFLRNEGIQQVMTKNRFEELAQFIHFNDSEKRPARGARNYDRLYKVRPILSGVLNNIQNAYYPGKNISIDEGMVAFRGRVSSFLQYMPAKPTKYGIKCWMAADSGNAYVVNFSVYLGREDQAPRIHGLGYDVIMKMARPYLNKFHHLFFDNFFSSTRLVEHLQLQNTYACATVRPNRKDLPVCAKNKLKQPGELVVQQKGTVLYTKWHDKRDVNFISTNVSPFEQHRMVERKVKGQQIEITKPYVSDLYTAKMGGVDRADQLRSSYTVGRQCKKWYRYLFWYALNLSICNALVLQCVNEQKQEKRQFKFRLALGKQLIGGFTQRKRNLLRATPVLNAQTPQHVSVRCERRKKECVQCKKATRKTAKGRPIETRFKCEQCDVALCKVVCFAQFHNMDRS
ncbi:hypothetical protein QZH41_003983 [Actinostola sp. cb2023]|nr:hypothetical protein QZH41_003983 [Actinostola sp. cb2023]